MAGIYIHIPFCKKACVYCNFHFSTVVSNTQLMVDAIANELRLRANYFEKNTAIHTIYFGGGTPSVLSTEQINTLLTAVYTHYNCAELTEITMEANPDDLSLAYLQQLKQHTAINRLSIGVQSFNDEELLFFNRAHNSTQVHDALRNAQLAGFSNISVDLIFGSPVSTTQSFLQNLQWVEQYNIPHLSCYSLTVEEKTALAHHVKLTKKITLNESLNNQQFELLMNYAANNNWTQYELSNYCKPSFESMHNTSYWQGKSFLGVGPSAHSYNGNERSFNVHNNTTYIKALHTDNWQTIIEAQETLTSNEHYNEYVMTRLRTIEGVPSIELEKLFGIKKLHYFETQIEQYIANGMITKTGLNYQLTNSGKYIADAIASDLFYVN